MFPQRVQYWFFDFFGFFDCSFRFSTSTPFPSRSRSFDIFPSHLSISSLSHTRQNLTQSLHNFSDSSSFAFPRISFFPSTVPLFPFPFSLSTLHAPSSLSPPVVSTPTFPFPLDDYFRKFRQYNRIDSFQRSGSRGCRDWQIYRVAGCAQVVVMRLDFGIYLFRSVGKWSNEWFKGDGRGWQLVMGVKYDVTSTRGELPWMVRLTVWMELTTFEIQRLNILDSRWDSIAINLLSLALYPSFSILSFPFTHFLFLLLSLIRISGVLSLAFASHALKSQSRSSHQRSHGVAKSRLSRASSESQLKGWILTLWSDFSFERIIANKVLCKIYRSSYKHSLASSIRWGRPV